MNTNRHSDELDELLHAQESVERAELAAYLSELRDSLPEAPPADVAAQHLAAITAAAAEAAHSAPVTSCAPSSRPWGARVRRLAGLTAVKVAIGATAAAAATGTGLAATGNLPDPVQQLVSDAADRIGIEIPAPADFPPTMLPDEASSTASPDEAPGHDDTDGERPTTPARPEGGAPPSEVPGRGQPPADPSDRIDDDRDEDADDADEAPSRRPDDTGPDASERADAPRERAPADAERDDTSTDTDTDEDDGEAPAPVHDDGDEDGDDADGDAGADTPSTAGSRDSAALPDVAGVPPRTDR